MLKQCGWIVVSYITRPLFIVGLVIWAFWQVLVVATSWETRHRIVTQVPSIYSETYRLPIRTVDDLNRIRAEGKQTEVDFLELSAVIRERPFAKPTVIDGRPTRISKIDQFPDYIATIAKEFPNVRGLSGVLLFNGSNVQHKEKVVGDLAEFQKLEVLSLVGSIDDYSDLASLQNISNLRMLDLSSLEIKDGTKPFLTLNKLETLTLGNGLHPNNALLAVIAQWPQLKTLVLLGGFGINPQQSITPKGLADLRQSTSLRLIYVGATNSDGSPLAQKRRASPPIVIGAVHPSDWWKTNLIDTVAVAVRPGVSVRNAYQFPMPSIMPFFMGALFIGMFIGIQLAAERSSIMSWLASGHKSRPLLMATIWMLAFSTISALLAANTNLPLTRTFPLAGLLTLVGAVLGLITLCSFLPNIIRVLPGLIASVTFYGGIVIPNHFWDRIGYFEYLQGGNPQGTIVVLASMAVLVIIAMIVYIPRHEYVTPLNTFRALATGESIKVPQSVAQMPNRGMQKWLFSSYDQRLEDALSSDRLKSNQGQIARWRVAIPMGGWGWWIMLISTTAVVTFISYLLPAPFDASIRLGALTPMTLMAPIIIGFAWRQRRKVFNVELLRPKTRALFQREMRSAFLRDLIPAFLWGVFVLVYIALSGNTKFPPREVLQFEAILAPAAILLLSVITATIVLIRGIWVTGALYILLCIGFGISMSILQFMVGATSIMIAVSIIISLLSLAGLAWLDSYWKRMEIGR